MEHRYPNNIAAIRKKYGLTQKELAARCEINVSALDPATSSAVLDCSACGRIPKRYYSNGKYLSRFGVIPLFSNMGI